jgi:hypothetical protein
VSDIVEESGRSDNRLLILADRSGVFRFAKEGESAAREVVGAERVLKAGVCGAWVDEVGPPQLPYVSETLEHLGVDEAESELVDTNVIPDGVAQYLEVHGPSF